MEELDSTPQQEPTYNDDDIKTLDWMEHIRISVNWAMAAIPTMASTSY